MAKKTKTKSKSKRDEVEDDFDDVDDSGSDESGEKKPGADAYTGLVVITTICLIAAAVLFYLDGDKYASAKDTNPVVAPNALIVPPETK